MKKRWFGRGAQAAAVLVVGFAAGEALAQNVTYTDTQALRGAQEFGQACAKCHGPSAGGAQGPALVGAKFDAAWRGKPALQLFEFISNNMPYDEPGALGKDTYVSIMAHILKLNGVAAGAALVVDPPGVIPAR
jgi:mono/diheme cytochrome c family protein